MAFAIAVLVAGCGGGDSGGNQAAGNNVTCGTGTVLDGTMCVLADGGAGGTGGSGGQLPDAGTGGTAATGSEITCGPGTVLQGDQCVAADGGVPLDGSEVTCGPGTVLVGSECVPESEAPGAPRIARFTADTLWGDAPLDTTLTWTITAPVGVTLDCELDTDGNGSFETSLPACDAVGSLPISLATPGRIEPVLRVTASGITAQASEYLFVNQVQWAPSLVRVRSLAGLESSVLADDGTVTLTFDSAANVPSLAGDAILWDEAATGFVRHVQSSSTTGTAVVLDTVEGSILDIATDGFWGRRDAEDDSGQQTRDLKITNCDKTQLAETYSPEQFGVPEISVTSGDDQIALADGKILVGMSASDPAYDFHAGIFSALATIETRLCGNVSVRGSKEHKKEILVPGVAMGSELDFGFFKASAGFMPRVGFAVKGTAKVDFATVAGARSTLHVHKLPGQPAGADLVVNGQFKVLDVVASAEGEVKVYVRPAIELVWGNPQKKCEQHQTVNNGSLKIGVDAEFGVKATVTLSASPSGSEACVNASWYGDATAQFIPPLKVIDCAEVTAPLFDKPFYDQCWTLSGGAGGGTGGTAGAGGTGGSGGSAGQGGTGGTAGAGGSAGQGGTGGAAGAGGSAGQGGTGGSGGQPPCSPEVTKVTPDAATVGQRKRFAVVGACLLDTLAFHIGDCANMQSLGVLPNYALFECTPLTEGQKAGVVKDRPAGTELKSFTVTFYTGDVSGCDAPLLVCDGQCVNPTVSPKHCGGCFNECSTSEYCNNGACEAYGVTGRSCAGSTVTCGVSPDPAQCCAAPLVPGGTFKMGSPDSDTSATGDEKPEHDVTVSDFRLDMFEVTVARFRKFVHAYPGSKPAPGAGGHPLIPGTGWNPGWNTNLSVDQGALKTSLKCGGSGPTWTDREEGNEGKPITCVHWYHAFAFCAWDGGRLPTEAEWEYAAAGGSANRKYPWGGLAPTCGFATFAGCGGIQWVGTPQAGVGRWGHHDLAGNVWERAFDGFTEDWYATGGASCNNCANMNTDSRVARGGVFDYHPKYLRAAYRGSYYPTNPYNNSIGFRCARSP